MSWDDIDVMSSDAEVEWVHPIQLIMSADKIVELKNFDYPTVLCAHIPKFAARAMYRGDFNIDEPVTVRQEMSRMRLASFSWVQHTKITFGIRFAYWEHNLWYMALCSCGTLYWRDGGTKYSSGID